MRCYFPRFRYDILSDGLEDVAVDSNMNTRTSLEDEEALDAIDDIWQESCLAMKTKDEPRYKLRQKNLTRPYVAYEPIKNNCDSLKTWSTTRFQFVLAQKIKFKFSTK
jgi:hypothetical protein